ncbi:hypothetical protein BUALT_Bualt19G0036300 [Buddleja alternifolia]|uniref:HIT-type domain-containing protein n=1 Tax=Buddleja alternifolia TaxID=168488 RepID=A0AAV6W6V1_9LAMI|nr:hypothetical protein BUALT_Bualt19G0036300 [Buddleja alternifolia]
MAEKANQQPNLCAECKCNASKYKCPGCELRSCSLPCVNSHKLRTGCTGKRPTTNFVPISQFDDNLLLSDYNMLEDVKRIADSAQRVRVKLCGYSNFKLARHLKSLRSAAASRRTRLLFLPNGMSKRDTNRTYYNNMKKFISWTIEWQFHSTDVVLVDHGVNENATLSSVIENHLKPGPWKHPLRQFCDQNLDSLKFFIRTYPKGSKSPSHLLDIKAPIREQLANIVILEYPVIHVFLPSHPYDFKVINDSNPNKACINKPSHDDYPSPKGVTFKEEEIEDGESPESQVLDLMNHANKKRETEKESEDSDLGPFVKRVKRAGSLSNSDTPETTTEDNIRNKSCIEQLVAIGDIDFDFGTGLMDMYSDLGNNPDDFLDFDGILCGQKDLEGGGLLMDEELEEGEIA